MAGFKINRVTSDIRLCLSELLRDVKDPRVSKMLSIVKLDVTGDMSYATVYVSAIEGSEKTEESVKALNKSAAGYIRRELAEVERQAKLEEKKLPEGIDYNAIAGLRLEAAEKLSAVRPMNIGQASRISGVSPADVSVLLIYLAGGKTK